MKKLMIAAAIVCAAAFAQAAATNWNIASAYDGAGNELGDTEGYFAYILVDSVTTGSTDTYSFSSAQAAVAKGDISFLEHALDHQEVSYGANSNIDLELNNTAKAYAVIIDAEDFTEATKAYIVADTQTVTLNGVGPEGRFDFGNLTDSADPGAWTAVGAPEPTSGLLLLLGVAGLALKRKRA